MNTIRRWVQVSALIALAASGASDNTAQQQNCPKHTHPSGELCVQNHRHGS